MVRKSVTARLVLAFTMAGVLLFVAAAATAQEEVTSPAERFEKGLKLLKERNMSLIVEYVPKDASSSTRKTINEYYEMVMLANKKVDTTLFVAKEGGEEVKIATVTGREMPSKGLGAWLWYKVCAAVGLLDSCREVGIVSSAS